MSRSKILQNWLIKKKRQIIKNICTYNIMFGSTLDDVHVQYML